LCEVFAAVCSLLVHPSSDNGYSRSGATSIYNLVANQWSRIHARLPPHKRSIIRNLLHIKIHVWLPRAPDGTSSGI
jgi:hypothetical protein